VDAGNNRVGVGTATPAVPLEVNVDAASDSELLRLTNTNAAGGSFVIIDRTGVTRTASTIYSTGVTGAWHTGILRDGGSSTFGYSISTASDNNVAEPFFLLTTGGGLTLTPNASSPAVFNEGGVDADFRVESDTQTHAFFVDAGTSRVGINSGAPQYKLHVVGGNGDQLWLDNAGEQFTQQYWANSGTVKGAIWLDNTNSKFEIYGYGSIGTTIYSNTAERVHFKSTGEAVFNDTGNDYDFRVESDTNTHMLFVDAGNNRVGINISAPSAPLDVKDQINVTNSSNDSILALKGTSFGYSSTYKALQVGYDAGSYSVSIAYDPSGNTDASFTGDGSEILFRNGAEFLMANLADDTFFSMYHMTESESVFNQDSRDLDFRVESDGNANALFVDGATGNIGLGRTPSAWGSGWLGVQLSAASQYGGTLSYNGGLVYLGYNAFNNGTNWIYGSSDVASLYSLGGNGSHNWSFAATGTEGNTISFTTAMTLANTGILTNQIGAVFNESGVDSDFRVESDTDTHAFFVDASANAVGIGTSSPNARLHVAGGFQQITNGSSSMFMGDGVSLVSGSSAAASAVRFDGDALLFSYSATERMRIDASGTLIHKLAATFNEDGADADFRVEFRGHCGLRAGGHQNFYRYYGSR
jgi:hypothetical protein